MSGSTRTINMLPGSTASFAAYEAFTKQNIFMWENKRYWVKSMTPKLGANRVTVVLEKTDGF